MTPETLAATHAAAFGERDRTWSAAEFATLLDGAIVTGDARSFVLGRTTADEAEILTLATHPAHRRLGLARHALSAFESEANRRGATRLFLEVAADNGPALGLYRAAGYVEVGRRKAYYGRAEGAPVDAIVLRKLLETGKS